MFGYVLPVKCKMADKDYEIYRASYCGVCKQLQKSYGVLSRFLLNYDLVLVSIIADALSGEKGESKCEGCFANPLMRRQMCHGTNGLSLGADGLVMLSYHKMIDNITDEKFLKRILYRILKLFANPMYKKATKRQPQLHSTLSFEMKRQQELEACACANCDEASDPTAKMCEAIFSTAAHTEEEQKLLARIGLFCGQIVYLLDAAEDYLDDEKEGKYNVFLAMKLTQEEAIEAAKRRCSMAAGEIALCYNALPLKQHKDILNNIFFLGLPAGIEAAGVKRTQQQRRTKHGKAKSV